jgi:aryl-alcohol dehydrogenase-like predicted oxidoreductase
MNRQSVEGRTLEKDAVAQFNFSGQSKQDYFQRKSSMRYRSLGDTGLKVSEISLGTAEIGLDYGFRGNAQYGKPDTKESIRLLHTALDHGINLIDTARAYGNSEDVIGQAFEGMSFPPYISSKVLLSEALKNGLCPARRDFVH